MATKKMFTTRLDPDLLKRLKMLAVELERPVNSLLEEGIKDLLKKYGKEPEEGKKSSPL